MKDALNYLRSSETGAQPETAGEIQGSGSFQNQEPPADRDPEDIFNSLDINNDNILTLDELPERILDRALRFDLNGDSVITEEEYFDTLSVTIMMPDIQQVRL